MFWCKTSSFVLLKMAICYFFLAQKETIRFKYASIKIIQNSVEHTTQLNSLPLNLAAASSRLLQLQLCPCCILHVQTQQQRKNVETCSSTFNLYIHVKSCQVASKLMQKKVYT